MAAPTIDRDESRRDRYRKWFRLFDASGDHFIAEIAKADVDGDGRVTEEEYLAVAMAQGDPGPVLTGMHEAMARGGFASFDIDGDGGVNLSDFVLAHAAFGLDPGLQAVIERFHRWDTDHDGRITLEEWLPSYRLHQLTDEAMPFFFCVD